jgi:iron complex transport system substrate-binding protein
MENRQPTPQRIVSLTASLTEILFALGVEDRVVGVTDTCDYPDAVFEKPNVACWFDPDMDKLIALKPDLVIGSASAHLQLKAALERQGIDVMLADPESVDDVLDLIEHFGVSLGATESATELLDKLNARLALLDAKVGKIPAEQRLTVCRILEWDKGQIYVAGPKSFQYDVIARAGGLNVSGEIHEAYPKIPVKQLGKWDPAAIFFCGYPKDFILKALSRSSTSLRAVEYDRLFRFDCNLTCRSGPRIVDMAELLHKTLYEN